MSNFSQWFGFNKTTEVGELPEIFPMPILLHEFVRTDVVTIFSKILTDVLERTHGLTDEQMALMWDNCVKSNSSDGLITMLAKAMAEKQDLFLVYDKAVQVIRRATGEETRQIQSDYETQADSKVGVYISFKNFLRADLIKLYSGFEYCTVSSLNKSMNLSKAVQLKFSDLRGSVSLVDSSEAKGQAQEIAKSLGAGRDIMLDAKDSVETAKIDLTAVNSSIQFIANKMSFYLGLPASYLTGEQTTGMGTTGENDTKAIERGLKAYFFSIMKPTLKALFDVNVSYKSQDFRMITSAMEVLKIFALTDEELVSLENKQSILNSLLGLPEDAEGDEVPEPISPPPVATSPVPPTKEGVPA